jgi:hypothetical protein
MGVGSGKYLHSPCARSPKGRRGQPTVVVYIARLWRERMDEH